MLILSKLEQLRPFFNPRIIFRITPPTGIYLRFLSRPATSCDIRRRYRSDSRIQEHGSRKRLSLEVREPSPEVRKEFDFSCFYRAIREKGLPLPCDSFLSWFVGFTEGDGSFVTIERGKICMFVVTQSCNDVEILYHIQKSLGFGRVYKQGVRTSRFVVQDRSGLYILFSLFNGNLIFPRQKLQFKKWVEWAGLGFRKKGLRACAHSEALEAKLSKQSCTREGSSNTFRYLTVLREWLDLWSYRFRGLFYSLFAV